MNAPLHQAPVTVWVAPGCTRCRWCHQLLPQVFADSPTGSVVRAEARPDGQTCTNADARVPLRPGVLSTADHGFLQFVADGCPARVIHVDH